MAFSSPFMAKSPLHQGIGEKEPSVVETDASKEKRELSQETKDSLQKKACKRDKPFYSKKHGKYVECEDGVLTNTPTNTSTYEKL